MVRTLILIRLLSVSFVCILIESCLTNLNYEDAYSDYKYDNSKIMDTSNKMLQTVNGFYCLTNHYKDYSSYQYYVFYADGMVYKSSNIIGNDISKFKQKLINSISSNQRINYFNHGSGLTWGLYKIIGNKIILRICFAPGEMRSFAWEEHFQIKDSMTIKYLGNKDLPENKHGAQNKIGKVPAKEYFFYEFDSIPSSDCWLKHKRWFWADKEAYKAYMKKLKEEGKKK